MVKETGPFSIKNKKKIVQQLLCFDTSPGPQESEAKNPKFLADSSEELSCRWSDRQNVLNSVISRGKWAKNQDLSR